MKTVGIICEYNPFHNGHIYHLKKAKEMFPDALIILILNGYFLQRGDISIISKRDKVKIAILNEIDLIIELPFVFGTQSADTFANKSIEILEKLQTDYVIFGSESNNLTILNEICDYQINNAQEYNNLVKEYLDKGINYPTALARALKINFEFNSNDLLGISYLKAIKSNNYHIEPKTIQRTNNYLDTLEDTSIISATNIREKIKQNKDITKYIPKIVTPFIKNISLNNYFKTLKYKIITEPDLSKYLDVDEGIENKLKKVINNVSSTDELIEKTKSKRYTYNKLRRMLIHILIGFTKNDNQKLKLDYIKILGFNNKGKKYLNKIKKDLDIPTKPSRNSLVYDYELKCAAIYDLITNDNNLEYEISNKPFKL